MARALLLFEAEEERLRQMLILRKRQLREDRMPMQLPEQTFVATFRLGKDHFKTLCEDLMPLINTSQKTWAIKPEIKILAALQFYATGSCSNQRCVGNDFNLGLLQTSVSDCLAEVTEALNQPQILRKNFGFPGVLGCIDGTHVAIIRPKDYEEAFFNRKMYHFLNVLVICDADLRILHVDASFGGASHDSHIWNLCPVKAGMQRLHEMGQIFWFLGDSVYAQRPWMMTHILNAHPGSPEEHYTNMHVQARNTAERCFGILKTRFRCLFLIRCSLIHLCPLGHRCAWVSKVPLQSFLKAKRGRGTETLQTDFLQTLLKIFVDS
ncbi:hypothetical protein ABMA28_000574 [Loxostege sticticalis]|uniref:DDE Tnp4 domain-containing protein n=1 Tax=Loxostege sticticalis TaxID=481309 RepID=A0ABD0TSQ3_LOXSC